jgi:cell volume regulation protein A
VITEILIAISTLLLLAYIFDLTASRTKIPSVVLLLFMGWGLKELSLAISLELPDLSMVLPVMGNIGLMLIVLDGSLELEVNPSKFSSLKKAAWGALVSTLMFAFLVALLFQYFGGFPFKQSLANALPLAVISSSIAIPTARHLAAGDREFITYESSLSDIIGVILFNFVALNEVIDTWAFVEFGFNFVLMVILSLAASAGLSILLHRINHHVKFIPIMVLMLLVYSLTKLYHLPSLLFVIVFGLFLGNVRALRQFKWTQRFPWGDLAAQVPRFHEITGEMAFLIRALFFLLFGFSLESSDVLDPRTLVWSVGITGIIYLVRGVQLRLSRLPLSPLLFIAPRGLITILLFLSLLPTDMIPLVNKSLLTQIILLTSAVMMVGMLTAPSAPVSEKPEIRN